MHRMFRQAYNASKERHRERLISNERLKDGIEKLMSIRRYFRFRSRARTRKRDIARIRALRSVQQTLQSAVLLKAKNVQTVFNVALYLLQLDQDLAFFTKDMVWAIGDRRRAFLAKYEALLLYEAAEDLPHLLGKKFRDAIGALALHEEQVQKIASISSDLNKFWIKNRKFLGGIRNAVAAHRDHDALRYVNSIEAIEPLEVMTCAAELSTLLNSLVQELARIADFSPHEILHDVLISIEKTDEG